VANPKQKLPTDAGGARAVMLGPRLFKRVMELLNLLSSMEGTGTVTIQKNGPSWQIVGNAPNTYFGLITGHNANTSGIDDFTYTVVQAYKPTAGYGGWAALPNGRTWTNVYNANDNATTMTHLGSGIAVSNIPAGFSVVPLPNNTLVIVTPVNCGAGIMEYWIFAAGVPLSIDGVCGAT
jgi:hypothetical protein